MKILFKRPDICGAVREATLPRQRGGRFDTLVKRGFGGNLKEKGSPLKRFWKARDLEWLESVVFWAE